MSDFQWNDGKGGLFLNNKDGNDARPDYTGQATINGQPVQISAWVNESKGGKKYLALTFQEPRQQVQHKDPFPNKAKEPESAAKVDFGDDIPFN